MSKFESEDKCPDCEECKTLDRKGNCSYVKKCEIFREWFGKKWRAIQRTYKRDDNY